MVSLGKVLKDNGIIYSKYPRKVHIPSSDLLSMQLTATTHMRGPPKCLKVCQFRVADDRFSYPHTTKALEPVYDIFMPGASIKNRRYGNTYHVISLYIRRNLRRRAEVGAGRNLPGAG